MSPSVCTNSVFCTLCVAEAQTYLLTPSDTTLVRFDFDLLLPLLPPHMFESCAPVMVSFVVRVTSSTEAGGSHQIDPDHTHSPPLVFLIWFPALVL